MPRNGSDIFYNLPGTEGVPDTTIESEKYNNYIADIAYDLNWPRPIVSGGTGSSTADGALASIGAEKASQVVTNYDSHVWRPGSFYSATTATTPPVVGHAFTGYVTSSDPPADPPANLNVVVNARDQNDTIVPGRMYVREKKAGVWGLWKLDGVSMYVQDTPPTDAPDKSLWWESDSGLLYLRYNDGAGAPQWVIASPQPDISVFSLKAETDLHAPINSPTFTGDPKAPTPTAADNDTSIATTAFVNSAVSTAVGGIPGAPSAVVRYDIAQTLTAPQLIQARTNIYAAPFDAMAYSGLQINGGMEVDQAVAGNVSFSNNEAYFIDSWLVGATGAVAILASPGSGGGLTPPPGFSSSIRCYANPAVASMAAGDCGWMRTRIEGYRVSRLAWGTADAQSVTIGFWVTCPIAMTATLFVQNSAGDRSYVADFLTVANTWTYRTITIPGDTTGTWNKNNTTGIVVGFCFGCGTTRQGVNNTWNGTSARFGTAQTGNLFSSAGQQAGITGVTVLPGTQAPTAAQSPNIMRPYDQELVTCQRYYRWLPYNAYFQAYSAGESNASPYSFWPPMRAAPTLGTIAVDPAVSQILTNCSATGFLYPSISGAYSYLTATAVGGCQVIGYRCAADARL